MLQLPKFIIKLKRLNQERKKWFKAGCPLRPNKIVEQLFVEVCSKCRHYDSEKSICNLCGCNINKDGILLNKLAWATTRCPDNPPKWIEYNDGDIVIPETEELAVIQTADNKLPVKKKCCGGK